MVYLANNWFSFYVMIDYIIVDNDNNMQWKVNIVMFGPIWKGSGLFQ